MTAAPAIRMINAHAEGELGYVAIDGVPEIPGRTIADRLDWLNSDAGIPLRRHLMLAPRANPACSVNLIMDPVDLAAEIAAASGATDLTLHELTGAPHYFEGHRPEAMELVVDWIRARFG
ncbi:MAG: hypothetical protein EBS20_11655 [Actinobacteria bacterium]|nr:hypothetical protein [Actinomycetota bacterium]